MIYIENLKEGTKAHDVYLCKTKTIAVTKNGKEYISVTLKDKTGSIDGKIWEPNSPGIEDFEALDYLYTDGDVISFNGSLQVNIKRIRKMGEGEYDPKDYLPVSAQSIETMYQELMQYIATVKNEYLKQLLENMLIKDTELVQKIKYHSAAKSVHHSFMGGLLEHTLSVVKMCDFYTTRYPLLNRDLLLAAAMCHDIGKTKELSAFPVNDYTDDGQLIGHIVIGYEMISKKIEEIPGFPKKLETELKHCILAHHGELEYGSPKKPALMEAVALNLADNTDARMQTMTEIFGNVNHTEWLGYNRLFESNLRKTTGSEE